MLFISAFAYIFKRLVLLWGWPDWQCDVPNFPEGIQISSIVCSAMKIKRMNASIIEVTYLATFFGFLSPLSLRCVRSTVVSCKLPTSGVCNSSFTTKLTTWQMHRTWWASTSNLIRFCRKIISSSEQKVSLLLALSVVIQPKILKLIQRKWGNNLN